MGAEGRTIVVLNAGSRNLRAVAFDWATLNEVGRDELRWDEGSGAAAQGHGEAAAALPARGAWPGPVVAVAHRVVHAGALGLRATAVGIDAAVREAIAAHADLAPLHNPAALAVIAAAERVLPAARQVAVLDSGFHATLPAHAYALPVPQQWHDRFGIRRFGFHGLSHAYSSRRAAEWLTGGDPAGLRVVVCHLGAGCSLCACLGGRSVATTMGYTPLDGLMMATRCVALDPGVVLALLRRGAFAADGLLTVLDQESGLKGVFGTRRRYAPDPHWTRGGGRAGSPGLRSVHLAVAPGSSRHGRGDRRLRRGGLHGRCGRARAGRPGGCGLRSRLDGTGPGRGAHRGRRRGRPRRCSL